MGLSHAARDARRKRIIARLKADPDITNGQLREIFGVKGDLVISCREEAGVPIPDNTLPNCRDIKTPERFSPAHERKSK